MFFWINCWEHKTSNASRSYRGFEIGIMSLFFGLYIASSILWATWDLSTFICYERPPERPYKIWIKECKVYSLLKAKMHLTFFLESSPTNWRTSFSSIFSKSTKRIEKIEKLPRTNSDFLYLNISRTFRTSGFFGWKASVKLTLETLLLRAGETAKNKMELLKPDLNNPILRRLKT